MEHGKTAIGVQGDVCDLVNQKVVAGTLPDDPEIIDERLRSLPILERQLETGVFRYTRGLVLVPGEFAETGDTLRLKMGNPTHVSLVLGECDQGV